MTQKENHDEPPKIRRIQLRRWASIIVIIVGYVSFALLLGVSTPFGVVEIVALAIISYGCVLFVVARVEKRLSFWKAVARELKAEDDILLQATAFSQTALWIYLNIIPSTALVTTMKWLVPSAAVLFYVIRGYAKLKDNNEWRYNSMFVLALVIGSSLSIVVRAILGIGYGILMVQNVDMVTMIVAPIVGALPMFVLFSFGNKIKKRYGL